MSNYGTTYSINQSGDLYTLDNTNAKSGLSKYKSSRGTTVNSPLNYRFLKLFRGYDNELFFYIKNQDRKPIMLHGMTINVSLIDRPTGSTIVNKKTIIEDFEEGYIKVVFTAGETVSLSQGLYDLVFSYTNNLGLTLPLFCDLNMRPNYTVEVNEDATPSILTTAQTSEFILNNEFYYSGILPASGYFNKLNSMVTIAVYCTNFTGKFWIEGTLSDNPTESDWFNIILGTYTQEFFPYENFNGVDPWTFRTNIKYIRSKFTQESGTLDKVVIRV